MDYRGVLHSLDGYMNIALEQTEVNLVWLNRLFILKHSKSYSFLLGLTGIDLLLLGSWTRLSCSRVLTIKWNLYLAKIMIHSSPPTGWTNWSISDVQVSNLNWRQSFPCYDIHLYSILKGHTINGLDLCWMFNIL